MLVGIEETFERLAGKIDVAPLQRKKQVHKRDNGTHPAQLARFVQYLRFTGKISPTYEEYPSYRFAKANLSTIFKLIMALLVL